ncbi:MAG: arylsulfatase [Bryobacterales bacterium]|nr:arylsulfatase [Bryobacterales bacterium]
MPRVIFALLPALLFFTACSSAPAPEAAPDDRPNIVLIMTDDQGWGQLGVHGDPVLKTPHIDKLAAESVEFTRFYASPVCAPTRASLMTGRYNYRTGVVDTFVGRAMMAADEVTIAERLGQKGYRTGIFGKWHLGDNYPMRAMDQGFQEAVIHRGGGIGQPSDPPGSSYFDPILFRNGEQQQIQGYCTDIFFNEAMRFIDEGGEEPFFVYLPTNSAHSPYQVPDSYREPYAQQGLEDKDARIYGMITNIDDNVGRLLAHLDQKGMSENTIFIFMTDNGPTTQLYTAGLRAQKASVYEDGIRVPFFLRWPAKLQPKKVETIAAHIDVTPTLMDAIGSPIGPDEDLDGRSLMPLLTGDGAGWRDRFLYIQSHRGNEPELWRNVAVIGQEFKLVQPLSFAQPMPRGAKRELYNLVDDPGETTDLSSDVANRERIATMTHDYEIWFQDVGRTRGYAPQRIFIGTEFENPVTFTRQDWRVTGNATWAKGDLGSWAVEVREPGLYDVQLDFDPLEHPSRVDFHLGAAKGSAQMEPGADTALFEDLEFQHGPSMLEARIESGGHVEGVKFVHVTKK